MSSGIRDTYFCFDRVGRCDGFRPYDLSRSSFDLCTSILVRAATQIPLLTRCDGVLTRCDAKKLSLRPVKFILWPSEVKLGAFHYCSKEGRPQGLLGIHSPYHIYHTGWCIVFIMSGMQGYVYHYLYRSIWWVLNDMYPIHGCQSYHDFKKTHLVKY